MLSIYNKLADPCSLQKIGGEYTLRHIFYTKYVSATTNTVTQDFMLKLNN